MVQTGRSPATAMVYPCVGAVVSLFKGYDAGYKGLIPPYIVLTQPQGRFSEAGFLGPRYKPFATGGDPAQNASPWRASSPRASPTSGSRSAASLLHKLDTLGHAVQGDPQLAAFDAGGGPGLRPDPGRRRQGLRSLAGERRPARPLRPQHASASPAWWRGGWSRAGVPYITINYGAGTPTSDNFQAMRRKLPELDKGLATPAAGPVGPRPAGQHHRLVLRRIRPHAQGAMGSRPGTAGAATTARSFPPWSPAADSRAATSWAPPTPRAKSQGPARLSVRPHRQHLQLLGIDPDGKLPHPLGWSPASRPPPPTA